MKNEQRALNRQQLIKCFLDLADRAEEIDEANIACICHTVSASLLEGSDEDLAILMCEYSKMRIQGIKDYLDDLEKKA